jgi:hypothetical protein
MLAVLSLGGASRADTDPGRVRSVQYQVTELSFTATRQYARPATNVHMEAVFNAPSGTTLTVPAFWDGGQTWRVRFSPIEPGKWIYGSGSGRPVLEGEVRYEGILGFSTDDTREAAYRAIQAGSFGFTYGSHGLYYPTQDENDKMGWDLFGKSPVWDVALRRPGGDQMRHLRSCYESVEWWKLKPKPTAVETESPLAEMQRILTKADGDTIFLIYFPRRMPAGTKPRLSGVATGSTYSALWFDPRTGKKASLKQALTVHDGKLPLPRKPDERDWMLILRKK